MSVENTFGQSPTGQFLSSGGSVGSTIVGTGGWSRRGLAGVGGLIAACGEPYNWAGVCRRPTDAGVRRKAWGRGESLFLLNF